MHPPPNYICRVPGSCDFPYNYVLSSFFTSDLDAALLTLKDFGGIESVLTTSLVQVTTAKTCYSVDVETPESFVESFRFRWNVAWSGLYLHGAGEILGDIRPCALGSGLRV